MPKFKIPHFGPSGRPETMNESELPRAGEIGVVYEEGTKRWQIVKIVDAANAAIGDVVYWKDYAAYTVTPTIANSSRNEVAGVMEVIATGADYFVAVRQGGLMDVKATGTVAAGDILVGDSSDNRLVAQTVDTSTTQTKFTPVGIGQAAVSGGKASTFLKVPSV